MSEYQMTAAVQLEKKIIDAGYCIGCGACASLVNTPFEMRLDEFGLFRPMWSSSGSGNPAIAEVCPFFSQKTEDDIARQIYSGSTSQYDRRVGYYRSIHFGSVAQGTYRQFGSSGGVVTWALKELLNRGIVDAVIHLGPTKNSTLLFSYGISESLEEITEKAKSRYYPGEFSAVVQSIRESDKRYAFVGVPCQIKAIRLLSEQDSQIADRITHCIAIFCGHMKSAAYAELIAWQHGIRPGCLRYIDFRVKLIHRPASHYGVEVVGLKKNESFRAVSEAKTLYGTNWGVGFFKPKACDYCDDVAGELADLSCGDAWISPYVEDPSGSSVVIVRSRIIQFVVQEGIESGALEFFVGTPDQVYESQAGNYRHRHEGLAWRLSDKNKRGVWHPRKRISPEQFDITSRRKRLYYLRAELSARSHIVFRCAKQKGSIASFYIGMAIIELKYHWHNRSIKGYIASRMRQIYHSLVRRIAK